MQLKAFRQRDDKVEVSHYRVNVNKFRSRLNISCITEKLHVKVKFDGWPEVSNIIFIFLFLANFEADRHLIKIDFVNLFFLKLRTLYCIYILITNVILSPTPT